MAADDIVLWSGGAGDNAFITVGNYEAGAIPQSTGGIIFPAMAADSTKDVAGSDQSAIEMVTTMVEEGCYLNFGSRVTPLFLDTDAFYYNGQGSYAFFNIEVCAEVQINNGASASSGYGYGFHLVGSSITLLLADPGGNNSVGLAAIEDTTLAVTTLVLRSGNITIGDGLTNTTLHMEGGTVENSSSNTTLNMNGGTYTVVKNKPTTLNLRGGRVYYNSADAPTTTNLYGGVLDMSQDSRAKTFATVNLYKGATVYDPANVLTITSLVRKDGGTTKIS